MKRLVLFLLLLMPPVLAAAGDISWLPEVEVFPHSTQYAQSGPAEADYQLGLGALQKIGGRWRLKHEEHVQGQLVRYTWQIDESYTAVEGFEWMQEQLAAAELLYQCKGRSCGSSAQWASRVFHQRVLYGHDERQHYMALRLEKEGITYSLVLYAVDRANRRHYLHLDVLRHDPETAP